MVNVASFSRTFFKNADPVYVTDSANTLKVLLSFAVGGLLGDVFLHLLPETWANSSLNKGTKILQKGNEKNQWCQLHSWQIIKNYHQLVARSYFGESYEITSQPITRLARTNLEQNSPLFFFILRVRRILKVVIIEYEVFETKITYIFYPHLRPKTFSNFSFDRTFLG